MAVPIVGLVAFGAYTVSDRRAVASSAETVELLAELSVRTGNLLHETQRERGVTALYLSSGGTEFGDELPDQHGRTDGSRAALVDYMAAHGDDLPPAVVDDVGSALEALDHLEERRRRALAFDAEAEEIIGWYSGLNADLLSSVAQIASATSQADIAVESVAYAALLNAKERAGLERAHLSAVFAQDEFAPGQLQAIVGLIAAKNAYLGQFESAAGPEVLAFYRERQRDSAVAEVEAMETLATENVHGGFGVEPTVWFDTMTRWIDLLKEVEDFQADRITASSAQVAADAEMAVTVAVLAGLGVVLVVCVVGGLTTAGLVGELRWLSRRARRIADGDLNLEPLPPGVDDDLGRLRESFNAMTESLGQMVDGLLRSSGSLSGSSAELMDVYERMSATTDDSASVVETAAQASDRLSATITVVAQSIEELNTAIRSIAAGAERAAGGTTRAVSVVDQTLKTIADLGESSSEIGAVIDLIDDIAEQTNLLALNATIEAARAGEDGKGFVVVANEVKLLAAKTGDATTEITRQIQVIQEEITRAQVENTEMAEIIAQINEVSSAIAAAAEEQSASMADIAGSMDASASAASEIGVIIDHVAASAQRSQEASESSHSTAVEMSTLASDLERLIDSYT